MCITCIYEKLNFIQVFSLITCIHINVQKIFFYMVIFSYKLYLDIIFPPIYRVYYKTNSIYECYS